MRARACCYGVPLIVAFGLNGCLPNGPIVTDGGGGASTASSSSSSGNPGGSGGNDGAAGTGGAGGTAGAGGQGQGGMGPCTPGAMEACYSGPAGTAGVGICKAGSRVCLPDGSGYGECFGEVLPQVEHAGTVDDEDCSGADDCTTKVLWSFRLGADAPPSPPQAPPVPYYDEQISSVGVTNTGDILLAGGVYGSYTYAPGKTLAPGAFLLRLDPSGTIKNSLSFSSFAPRALYVAPDGGYFLYWSDPQNGFNPITHHFARYDASDTFLFEKTFSAVSLSLGSIAFLPNGHLLAFGDWRGTAVLDNVTLQGPIEMDSPFLAELDASATVLWAKTFTHNDRASGNALLLDSSGDVFVSGTMGGYHVAGAIGFGGPWLQAPLYQDAFLARLTANGDHVWSRHITVKGEAGAGFAKIAPDGSLLLTGGDARNPPDGLTVVDLGLGPVDINNAAFLARLNATDGLATSMVVSKNIQFGGLQPIAGGNIHFVSPFKTQGAVNVLGKPAASHSGSRDFLIGTMDAANQLSGACIYGTSADEILWTQTIAPDGSYIVVGLFGGTLDLGKGPMTSVGTWDFVVAKIMP